MKNIKKTIEIALDEARALKSMESIEKFAGLLQLTSENPLAKAFIENGLNCDLLSISDTIESIKNLEDINSSSIANGFGNMIYYKNHLKTAETKLTKYADSKIVKLKGELKRLENGKEMSM